jgi:LDH2 family malate/lactate/ureidoglycolate dehydrogenase
LIHLTVSEARALSEGVLQRHGFSAEEARIITDVLVEAHLWGRPDSGLRHLVDVVERAREGDRGPIEVQDETDRSAVIDGANNPGFLTGTRAIRLAIDKARQSRLAAVGVRRSFVSGINGYYVSLAAREGLIALMTVSGTARVAPWGGIDPLLGTNPLAVAVPTLEEPVVFDMSTAAVNVGTLRRAASLEETIPAGWAVDRDGEPTTAAARALEGAILPFGDHKGFGLAMIVQCLGILAGGAVVPQGLKDFGSFFLVIDPELFMPLTEYKTRISELVRRIRESRPRKGGSAVRVPGERSLRERAYRLEHGIDLDDRLHAQLLAL